MNNILFDSTQILEHLQNNKIVYKHVIALCLLVTEVIMNISMSSYIILYYIKSSNKKLHKVPFQTLILKMCK